MNPELLWKLGRLGGGVVSSDSKHVAYTVRRYTLSENKGHSTLYVKNIETGDARALLKDWPSIGEVQWGKSKHGERLFVQARNDAEGATTQAWSVNPVDGGVVRISDVEGGIANLKVSPTGKHIAFTLDIKMDKTVNEMFEDLPKADARIIDSLMYRHWNQWHDYKYTHLHVSAIGEDGTAEKPVDLMKDLKADCPVPPFGGSEQFNWSPDGMEIAFTMKVAKNNTEWAQSTNSDVYVVKATDPSSRKNVSASNKGYDNEPVYSPNGRYLAFHSMERAGFEADRNRVMVMDRETGTITEATKGLDQMAHSATWLPDSSGLVFYSEYRGTNQIFSVQVAGNGATQHTKGQYNWSLLDIFPDNKHLLVSRTSMVRPAELAMLPIGGGEAKMLTDINGETFKNLELPKVEEMWVDATDGKRIHNWVIYPPNFDPNKKYPLITYAQGGPQGQIGQWFSYRWNFHLMAAHGDYIIVAPNRRGLPGFGRKWNDDISKDWGGQAMKDILSSTDAMLAKPFVDKEKTAAIGASFGGYTVYWLMGNAEERFKCMIAHCGVFNLESMYGSTEELFFVDWDLGGPYWDSPSVQKKYDQFSPHRYINNWKTPLLVIHGEKDFRVPVTQGMEAFQAAQIQGVKSKFLYFPEEGHWVQSPQNGVVWHRVFFEWLNDHCK
jgi:dipeptidyl aminopeptidase/acylaminoacyl peptidase